MMYKTSNGTKNHPKMNQKINPKRYQKSTKNRPKMHQKSVKNHPKMGSGGLRGRFGGLLGRLGRFKGFWRASWIVLEASWKRLGREKWPTWLQLGPKLAPKTEAKSVLGRPGSVLGASWRVHVTDFMYFWCIFAACLKKYAFEADFLWILNEKMFHGTNKISQIILRK